MVFLRHAEVRLAQHPSLQRLFLEGSRIVRRRAYFLLPQKPNAQLWSRLDFGLVINAHCVPIGIYNLDKNQALPTGLRFGFVVSFPGLLLDGGIFSDAS